MVLSLVLPALIAGAGQADAKHRGFLETNNQVSDEAPAAMATKHTKPALRTTTTMQSTMPKTMRATKPNKPETIFRTKPRTPGTMRKKKTIMRKNTLRKRPATRKTILRTKNPNIKTFTTRK